MGNYIPPYFGFLISEVKQGIMFTTTNCDKILMKQVHNKDWLYIEVLYRANVEKEGEFMIPMPLTMWKSELSSLTYDRLKKKFKN